MRGMEKPYAAVVESDGRIRLNTPSHLVHLEKGLRVVVAVLQTDLETAVSGFGLSESALSVDCNKPEEDDAWAHLQSAAASSFHSLIQIYHTPNEGKLLGSQE
jgi:hypothetical protein